MHLCSHPHLEKKAALHGHTALVHMLLQPCTDVNLADIRGDTALILAGE